MCEGALAFMLPDLGNLALTGEAPRRGEETLNGGFACYGVYRTKDGRWLVLCLLYDQWWPDLARHLHREQWLSDPRYLDPEGRAANNVALIAELDEIFATKTLAEWEDALATLEGVWAPLKSPDEVIADPHIAARHMLVEMPRSDGVDEPVLIPGNPIKLSRVTEGPETRVPWVGEHTDDVLRTELGLDAAELSRLREAGVIT